ncbi:MAG TPA: tetratricopeptide repeat protein [Anaerolineae bacterium]|nr:tetratricopeptide repeat protein [Anaerolineae bacterium]
MSELATGFRSLPPEYQHIIQLAQDQHHVDVTPLQELSGGWSGALIYLVSVASSATRPVEHLILKLDRKSKNARTDEVARHAAAQSKSPPEFARDHLANLAFERVESEGAIGIFYSIAGQSLQSFRPLSGYGRQHQLETIFSATHHFLLTEWNANPTFAQAIHPQDLLKKWLGFRLDPGAPIESFVRQMCRVDPDRPGVLIKASVFPNPLSYARQRESWGTSRSIDVLTGLQHGDLNTNNILVKFTADGQELAGYYLIDFALFKDQMPLLYDLRYLELSYLLLAMSQVSFAKGVDLILQLAEGEGLDPRRAPIEMVGPGAVIQAARNAFEKWVTEYHPSLHDDLWGQYWLAGVAAGLSYTHKTGMSDEQRMAGLIYAAANLKRYAAAFTLALPTDVQALYAEGQFGGGTHGKSMPLTPRQNLPIQSTLFIGRTTQVTTIKNLLLRPDTRLVTLLGPGGTGKTRLSLQVAQEVLEHFPDGVFFVPLADDTDANQFISRVAQQLEVKEGGRPLLENVKDYLRDKQSLLVLDNFEQLVAAAPIVADLLTACPQLKALTTSRIALNLHGEREYPVPPLDLPRSSDEQKVENLAANESIRLFIERAQAVQPQFALTDDNVSIVSDLCRRLDGLPLAIELAAARVKLLSPQAIVARLDNQLKLLTGGARDLPARQQTLRNAIEWSYNLLNEDEKILYARLGVFVGGFTLETAEAVCNLDGHLDVLETLTSLVNNSLLRQTEADGEPRFGLLETIRAYALERLEAGGELAAIRDQHAHYFGDVILKQASHELYSSKAPFWINWLEREHDNVRATLSWSLSTASLERIAGLVWSLEWFWYRRGYFSEGRQWADRVLHSPGNEAAAPSRAFALQSGGLMAVWQGEQAVGLAQLQESLTIWQRLESEQWVAPLLLANGIALINMGRDSAAQPLMQQALAIFEVQHQAYFHVFTLVHLGNAELGLKHPERARAWLEQALSEARVLGDDWQTSFALNNLGEVARTQGRYDQARVYYEESESILRSSGDKGDLARLVHTLGYIAQHAGDYARAKSQFRESLAMFRQLGNRRGMAECMAGLAGLKARQGNAEPGAVMLSAAESALKATGGAWWPADRVEVEANQAIIRSALSEDQLVIAQTKGTAMTLEQALTFASEQ